MEIYHIQKKKKKFQGLGIDPVFDEYQALH